MRTRYFAPLLLLCALPTALHADFSYTETTQITGGAVIGMIKAVGVFSKQARQAAEPIVSTVMVKGNRMVRSNPQRTEIIDLDKETITTIDHVKKQYTTVTFQQMKQQIEDAMKKAKEQKQTDASGNPPPDADVSYDVKVRNTGASKDVDGINASEAILSMAMNATDKKSGQTGSLAITNDMWMAPEVPGYAEARDFQRRFAEKLGTVFSDSISPAMLASQPGAGRAMSDMVQEMSKLKGIPVLQVMRMGTTANGTPLPAASEAPLPQTKSEMPSAGEVAKESATSAVANSLGLGGFGGFGRKKKAAEPPPDANKANGEPAWAVLIESNSRMSGFSQASVDPSKFDIPAGYKQMAFKIADQ